MKYLSKVAELGCILCQRLGHHDTPAEIHHLRAGRGLSQRSKDKEAIPLCPEHHRGSTGFHGLGKRAFELRYETTETELLVQTLDLLGR